MGLYSRVSRKKDQFYSSSNHNFNKNLWAWLYLAVYIWQQKTGQKPTNKSSKETKRSQNQKDILIPGEWLERTLESLQNGGRISYQTPAEPGFLPVQVHW
jgi:hypothetical protein